jgi:hypothetical protein
MHAAAYRATKQAAILLRSKILARGEPAFEAVMISADKVEYDHACISESILAYIVTKLGN